MQEKPKIFFMLGSHMDLFWMGTTRDCLDAGCDIISRAIELCGTYPEYCFYIESTVFAEYYLKNFPEKRERLMELITEGRFEIACSYADRYEHLYGGESIARHHILAKRWLKNELGISPLSTCHSDLPGLSPQIPQICAQAGISYYIRARGPCGVYDWSAPDGTRIIYCSVGYSYSKASDSRRSMEIGKIAESGREALPYYVMRGGYSDLEMADDDIITDVKNFAEKFPELDFAISSPSPVIKRYLDNPELAAGLPKLSGEWPMGWGNVCAGFIDAFQKDLYLENYLLAVEKVTALSGLYGGTLSLKTKEAKWWIAQGRIKGEIKPPIIPEGAELDEMWKAELYGQDHNYAGFGGPKSELDRAILKLYCEEYANEIMACGLSQLDSLIALPEAVRDIKPLARITVFNQMAWNRDAMVSADLSGYRALPRRVGLVDSGGEEAPFELRDNSILFTAMGLPSMGFKTYYITEPAKERKGAPWYAAVRKNGAYVVETPRYLMSVDPQSGSIASLFDKCLKTELTGGSAVKLFGEIIAYEESGPDVIYAFTGKNVRDSASVTAVRINEGDLSVTVEVETSLFDSKIVKEFTLYRDLPTIGIKATLYWWGKMNQQLRLCLPFAADGYRETSYGVPFYSMTWPRMMEGVEDDVVLGVGDINPDEIDSHSRLHIRDACKWLDVGYEKHGVAVGVKTTCTYIDKNNIEPMILRTGVSCGDPHVNVTNAGRHEIEFSLYPHTGGWREANVYRFGWENANSPICRLSEPSGGSGILAEGEDLFSTDCANVILTTVKPAYDEPGTIVVRFFETHGQEHDVTLRCPKPVSSAGLVNLLEEEQGTLPFDGKEITIPVKANQIVSVLIKF